MEKQDFKYQLGERVSLKPEASEIYPMARGYMEGIIDRHELDDLGYPMVWIKWDRKHWAYNGEADGWTMEAHFNPVKEEKVVPEGFDMNEFAKMVAKHLQSNDDVKKEDTHEPTHEDMFSVERERAIETLREPTTSAFIVIAVESIDDKMIPSIYKADVRESAKVFVDMTMGDLAANTHAYLSIREIERLERENNGTS